MDIEAWDALLSQGRAVGRAVTEGAMGGAAFISGPKTRKPPIPRKGRVKAVRIRARPASERAAARGSWLMP